MTLRILKFVSVVGLAFWLGGISFYGGVAVFQAKHVIDSHVEIGLVTRLVTRVSNLVGLGVLALLAAHGAAAWRSHGRPGRIALGASGIVMAAVQIALFVLWSKLSGMMDLETQRLPDRKAFYPWHERYMDLTGLACLAGLVHLWVLLSPPRPKP
jgi:hypothetical protein